MSRFFCTRRTAISTVGTFQLGKGKRDPSKIRKSKKLKKVIYRIHSLSSQCWATRFSSRRLCALRPIHTTRASVLSVNSSSGMAKAGMCAVLVGVVLRPHITLWGHLYNRDTITLSDHYGTRTLTELQSRAILVGLRFSQSIHTGIALWSYQDLSRLALLPGNKVQTVQNLQQSLSSLYSCWTFAVYIAPQTLDTDCRSTLEQTYRLIFAITSLTDSRKSAYKLSNINVYLTSNA